MGALRRQLIWGTKRGEVGLIVDVGLVPPPRAGRDWTIAAIAERQYGVVSRAQLLAAGIGTGAIATRIRRHRLHPLHRGVYAVGHTALPPLAREMAAVLACWPDAVVSHQSAGGAIWQLLEPVHDVIDLTVSRTSPRRRPGLRVHRSQRLDPEDVAVVRGIPVTSVARTLVDLAESVSDRELERAFDEATARRLVTNASITAAVERLQGRRGTGRLKMLLDRDAEPAFTRSEAEERLLALIRKAGLPAPEVNPLVARHTVDFLWRDRRLIVEVDGYRFHSTRAAFERDRVRDAELIAAGFRVVRVTWRQLTEQPLTIVARLAQGLAF
jgi:very-short-patch-repair endonuclease